MAEIPDVVGELLLGEGRPLSLAELRDRRERATQVFGQEAPGLQDYVRHYTNGRVVIARSANSAPGVPVEPGIDPTDQATCSAFASAHYGDPFSRRSGLGSSFPTLTVPSEAFPGSDAESVLRTVLADFTAQYRFLDDNSEDDHHDARDNKDVAPLPNAYNSPIHLSGLVSALRHLRMAGANNELRLGAALAAEISGWLRAGYGTVYEVRPSPRESDIEISPPNPYLSYWSTRALSDWIELMRSHSFQSFAASTEDEVASCRSTLHVALEASKNRLARIISTDGSSLHDAVGLVCSIASLGLLARRLQHHDEETGILVRRGVELLLTRYLLEDGSFAPKATALTTNSGYSLVLSTQELAAMLLHGLGPYLPDRHLGALDLVVDRIIRRRGGVRGWGSGAGLSPLRRPAFVACTALSFLRSYHNLLSRHISEACAAKLRIGAHVPSASILEFEFPESIGEEIQARVIRPFAQPELRHLASASIQLTGPSSRTKLDVSRRIAQELSWPFLSLTQELVRSAIDDDLLRELTDVVVFIDDILSTKLAVVGASEATQMSLGRADVSDPLMRGRRYLLVIATETSQAPDARTLGIDRIDRILHIGAPALEDRRRTIEYALRFADASASVRRLFEEVGVLHVSDGLIVEDLTELVRSCSAIEKFGGGLTSDVLRRELDIVRRHQSQSMEGG